MNRLYLVLIAVVGLLATAGVLLGGGGLFAPTPPAPQRLEVQAGSGSEVEQAEKAPPVGIEVGQQAPDFELTDLSGQAVKLSDFRGQHFVLLNFWASYCPYCRREMPTLEAVQRESSDLAVLGINAGEGTELIQRFLSEIKVSYPVLLDVKGETVRAYGVVKLPATFLIDKQGVIVWKVLRSTSEKELKEQVQKLKEK
jgi:peroxiredoxin